MSDYSSPFPNTQPVDLHLKRIMVAGTHSGVGKTTVALGIMSILSRSGYKVQGFKAGPDYIDISHHEAATGNISRNLDTWMMSDDSCRELFLRSARNADISIIEGVMGLYDGSLDGGESGSSAYLARILNAPVILVVDVKGMAQSAAAVALGFHEYDKRVRISGVILNRVGSDRQFSAIKKVIEDVAKIPVLGYLGRDSCLAIPERHLGLVPSHEKGNAAIYHRTANALSATLDINRVIAIAGEAGSLPQFENDIFGDGAGGGAAFNRQRPIRVAVARDEAFHFYYQDNLELLESYGAELCYFSPLNDKELPPEIDGIYIGGGFPELFGCELEANGCMRHAIKTAADSGVVIYAECGGMMLLMDKLVDGNEKSFIMCGVFPFTAQMMKRRQGLGYVNVRCEKDNILCSRGDGFPAHEFHWSSLVDVEIGNNKESLFAYNVGKGKDAGSRRWFDGLVTTNVLAAYVHVHFAANPLLAVNLLRSMSGQGFVKG